VLHLEFAENQFRDAAGSVWGDISIEDPNLYFHCSWLTITCWILIPMAVS
jgi:hypothetical protein